MQARLNLSIRPSEVNHKQGQRERLSLFNLQISNPFQISKSLSPDRCQYMYTLHREFVESIPMDGRYGKRLREKFASILPVVNAV